MVEAARRVGVIGVPRQWPLAQNHKTVDCYALRHRIIARGGNFSAGIVGAVAGHVDYTSSCLKRGVLKLGHRKVKAATDRGAISERTLGFHDLTGELVR